MNSQAKNNKSAKTAARNKLLEEVGNFHSVEDVDEKARIAEIVRQQYQTIYDRGNKHLGKPTTAKLIDIVCWTRNTTPSQLPKMGEKQVQSMISQWMAGKTVALPTDLPKKQQPDSASPATVAKSKASACNPSKGGKSKEAEGNTADEPKTTPTGDIVDVDQDVNMLAVDTAEMPKDNQHAVKPRPKQNSKAKATTKAGKAKEVAAAKEPPGEFITLSRAEMEANVKMAAREAALEAIKAYTAQAAVASSTAKGPPGVLSEVNRRRGKQPGGSSVGSALTRNTGMGEVSSQPPSRSNAGSASQTQNSQKAARSIAYNSLRKFDAEKTPIRGKKVDYAPVVIANILHQAKSAEKWGIDLLTKSRPQSGHPPSVADRFLVYCQMLDQGALAAGHSYHKYSKTGQAESLCTLILGLESYFLTGSWDVADVLRPDSSIAPDWFRGDLAKKVKDRTGIQSGRKRPRDTPGASRKGVGKMNLQEVERLEHQLKRRKQALKNPQANPRKGQDAGSSE